ncbi:lipoyl(octanoyl) transferase LipB [bacterium]|nr:lipoyl(octanoyl) transferase LipB [bacterium]
MDTRINAPIQAQILGTIAYNDAMSVMKTLYDKRHAGEISDTLLVLEHPPVITSGRQQSDHDLKLSIDELKNKKIDFVHSDRGGKLTCHEPGQLVVYFIFNLHERKWSVEKLVWMAEEGLKRALSKMGIEVERDKEHPGLWVEHNKKIAALGFHISRGITTHGIALNVNNTLNTFLYIIPCGIEGRSVTTISKELNKTVGLKETVDVLLESFEEAFGNTIILKTPSGVFATNP